MSLYLKYRPKTFDEIVGQPDAVKLMKAIVAQNPEDRPKVFLFGGASGCGKTTLATVFARAIGCDPNHSNFTVMDASKDRSIDRIRELCDMMGTRPIGKEAQARIFLLDECFEYHTPITCVDDNGELFTMRIGDLVRKKYKTKVLSVNKHGMLEPKEITGWFENSNKPVKTYHFKKDGNPKYGKTEYKITCSDNHRLFRPDGSEVKVADLVNGDRVRVVDFLLPKDVAVVTATYTGCSEAEEWQLAYKHLYDIEVKDNHNYIAGGVVAHNCHQLLKPAQEALLKKCEDTPPQTIIIFATTEPDALGKALRSRCKIITINPMSNKSIYDNLNRVIKAEGIKIDDKDVIKIARASDGNTRVSLQILENYMLNGMNADNAISMCGGMGEELKVDTIEICRIIVGKKQNEWEKVAAFCAKYKGQGESARQAILGYLRSCILKSTTMKDRMRFATLIEVFSVPHYDCSDAALPMQIAFALEV